MKSISKFFKDEAPYSKETSQGWSILAKFKIAGYGNEALLVVIAHRPATNDYCVGWNYDANYGYWGQGHYDFPTFEAAEEYVKNRYQIIREVKDSSLERPTLTQEDIDALNETGTLSGISFKKDDDTTIYVEISKDPVLGYVITYWVDSPSVDADNEVIISVDDFGEMLDKLEEIKNNDVFVEE